MRHRRSIRRGSALKRKTFWYVSPNAWNTSASGSNNFVIPLVTIPKDVAHLTSLATAAEAPHNNEILVERIRGQIYVTNGVSTYQQSLGIIVLDADVAKDEEGGTFAPALNAGSPTSIINANGGEEMARPWLWIWSGFWPAGNAGFPTLEVDIKVKRILRQGQGLFLYGNSNAGAPQNTAVMLRALLSTRVGR